MKRDAKGAMTAVDEHAEARRDRATEAERSFARLSPDGARRDAANWAWVGGSAHYDWMDHTSLFMHHD
ncbi:hypothetical protein WR30_15535 [Burkholderia contaminans FFH2055]|uniref:hypothetical protein n=1 Tax=Burkholderia contaminans TaxID=488447 RepID=UPI0006259491|nr:hypothetical protein [Burkholderia contaminans]AKM44791.1 hypothetical protein NL30_33310 [Burkholderia contaminans]KKL35172.1 hypothetical protein WR30_15535 [Burkholderia contaminans FFH2055]MEB4642566.1 hypothetical protein [Burkholderia contaminans]MEB4657603.1 hypothetical protein [Burkholderia contaminans]MEB4658951.1 hypothetical protein [Burkholderia contaminans]